MSLPACPSAAALSGFVLGTLPEPDLEKIARHLDVCPACEADAASLERVSDPVMAAVRCCRKAGPPRPAAPDCLGDFRILREIGRGGMGVVYEAEQVSLGRRVALKVLPRHALLEPELLVRFRRESRAAAALHQTNIVQVFGTGEQDGLHYFVMQLIPGVGLDAVLRELQQARPRPSALGAGGRHEQALAAPSTVKWAGQEPAPRSGSAELDPSVAAAVQGLRSGTLSVLAASASSGSGRSYWLGVARVGIQVAEALAFAHAHGVLHRDIKPSNLLLDPQGTVWVSDFGLAKALTDEQPLTQSGDIIGTVRYMAPERFQGKSDARGDIYSLGVTLYEFLTRRDAFSESGPDLLMRRVLQHAPPPPRKVNPEVPRDLETIVLKAMAHDPAHRYPNAGELANDLRRFVEDRPVRARRITGPERLWRWCRRDPRTAGLLGALLLALLAGLLGVATQWLRAEGKARDEADARRQAEAAEEEARADLYLRNIAQARLEWRLNNVAGAERLLDHCEPQRRGWEWHYLRRVNRPELATFSNPALSLLFGVAFSPDGHFLAFTGWDSYGNKEGHDPTPVEVWDLRRGARHKVLSVPGVGLRPAFSPDGKLLALSSSWNSVQLYDVSTGQRVRALEETGLASFSPDGLLLAVGGPKEITVRDVATGRLVHRFPSPGGRVRFSPDGKLLAVSTPRAVLLRAADTGQEVGRLPQGAGDLLDLFFPELGPDLAFSPDGKLLVTATNPPRVWDVPTRLSLTTLGGHTGVVPGVAFRPDGLQIATAGADGTVRLWDAQTGLEQTILRGHTGVAACVAFHPDGWCLASGGRQPGEVKLWDLTRHPEHRTLSSNGAHALAFDASGRLKLLNLVGRIQTREPESGRTEQGPRIDVTQRCFSPAALAAFSGDSLLLAAVSADLRTVKVFDTTSGRERAALRGLEALPRRVAFSQDGSRVAATTRTSDKGPPRAVVVHDAATGQALAHFRPGPATTSPVYAAVALSADGSRVAFDDYEGQGADKTLVRVCDVDTGRELLALPAGEAGICCLAFSPDGRLLAAGTWDGTIFVWDVRTGRRRCEDHLEFPPFSLAFSPNGLRLAAVGRELLALWDVSGKGKGILTLRGAPPRPNDAATNAALTWSPDGRVLAASNWDGSVSLWAAAAEADAPEPAGPLARVPEARGYTWHLDQVEAALASRQLAAASFHLQALRGQGEPPDLASRCRRAHLYLHGGEWERAGEDYDAVFAASTADCPDDAWAWTDYARVLLLRQDQAGYRQLLPRMLAHCGRRTEAADPEGDEVRACVLAPGAPVNPAEVVRTAEEEVRFPYVNANEARLSLALAHYRAGQGDKAVALAEEVMARNPERAWSCWPALALAHAQLGHPEEARRWLEKAEQWQRQEGRRRAQERGGFASAGWVDFEILLREASGVRANSEGRSGCLLTPDS